MSDRATIRLTASADGHDAIGQLGRAANLARDLEAIGFVVTLSGDIYIDARMAVDGPDDAIDPGRAPYLPVDVEAIRAKHDAG